MHNRRIGLILLLLALGLLTTVGCGKSDSKEEDTTTPISTPATNAASGPTPGGKSGAPAMERKVYQSHK